jgi:hypothetical protein
VKEAFPDLLLTGLFQKCFNKTCLNLIDTEFYIYSDGKWRKWTRAELVTMSFEEVIDAVSEELQIQLLFHLDLFKVDK